MLNLTVAEGLPGAEALHIPSLLHRIDHWTSLVARNTNHWRRSFVPEEDCPTENHFRMMAMITVVQRDLGVRYNPAQMTGPDDARDSRDNFLHGPLTGHGGTCCSLPIIYLAIGHRLDYPLHLVATGRHLFVRWDGGGERFNVECACVGYKSSPDEYYARWPVQLIEEDLASGYYLRNLTPRQVLAEFLAMRAHCFLDHLRITDSLQAYMHAAGLYNYFEKHWVIATMMQRILKGIKGIWRPRMLSLSKLIEIASPKPVYPLEKWALPPAQQELRRIANLHANRKPGLLRTGD